MEEEERENVESVSIGGFAEKIARDLIKETISETNSVKIWSIPCSSGCHNHSKQEGSNGHSSGGSLCWITETSEQDPEPSSSGTCSALSAETCSVKPTSFFDPGDKLNLTCSPSPRECLESEPCKEDRPPSTNSHPGDGTDLVHRRLKVRDQHNQQEAAGDSGSAGHGAEAGSGEKEEEKFEFRNKSEENLVSIHRNGKKQSLRKGLSVNDISETSSSNLPGGKASSKINLLKTLGLKKPKDEVTQRLSDGEDKVGGGNKMKAIKKTLTNMFHFKHRETEPGEKKTSRFKIPSKRNKSCPPCKRALPPVPAVRLDSRTPSPLSDLNLEDGEVGWVGGVAPEPTQPVAPEDESQMDFAASIEKVKDHGWYWGPLSGETAERILAPEPDGSFVVRDSSDHHYIFSLTFKLNGFVRHVRIEHDQGNFSFGSFTKFKSNTIVDFIENAVEHSRSGRYLFFLHRRPVLGPMRVQLLHPVSRFKRVQSLQHLCRYVIVKHVRRDHLDDLPVPNRIKQYLNTPFYYSEQVEEEEEEDALQQQLADRENADILDFQPDLDHPMLELDTQDRTSNQEQDLVSEPENLEHNRAEALSSVEYPDTLISPAPGAVSNPATSSCYPGSSLLSSPHPNRSSTPQNL